MENFTESLNMKFGKVEGAHVMTNVQLGFNAYDTLCLICAEKNIELNDISDNDFDSAGVALKQFCESANDGTGYAVSVWFD